MVYLQAVVPRRATPPAPTSDTDPLTASLRLRNLVHIALDVGCRIRPLTHLSRTAFASSVRLHLTAHVRSGTAVSGPVRIRSLHLRPGTDALGDTAELFGTAACAGTVFAFSGSARIVPPERLVTFRIAPAAAGADRR